MKNKIQKFVISFKSWSLRRKIFVVGIFVIFILIIVKSLTTTDTKNYVEDKVKKVDLSQSVLASGLVVSNTNLSLSFNKSGIIKSIKVSVGDTVKPNMILANLDQGVELASLTQARGALLSAKARYKKILEGATSEEVTLAEVALTNAKRDLINTIADQDLAVSNAYKAFLNSTPEATPLSSNSDYTAPIISGSYNLGKEGDIHVTIYYTGSGATFSVSGIASGSGQVTNTTTQPLGDSGLYIKFPSTMNGAVTDWIISIPNKKASNYLTNYNAYQTALKNRDSVVASAQALVDQRTAELSIKKASARPSDIDLAEADILSAEGALQSAQANFENTVLRAPALGTITQVNNKVGELVQTQKEVIALEDVKNLYVEAKINESNIGSVVLGQKVSLTFDGIPNTIFNGSVVHVDPSATTEDGIANYKIKVSINDKTDLIRPGMNANLNINVFTDTAVLVLPKTAILEKDGKKFVHVVTNEKRKKYKDVEVTTGKIGDGNLIEVYGLNEGDEIFIIN